ncbi:MAG: SIS domain-containing protein, partial [Nitrospinota bacterium]
ERVGLVGPQEASLGESVALMRRLRAAYGLSGGDKGNPARELAERLKGKTPLIWGSALGTASIAFRWKTQLLENSKVWAASGELPEMTHNEVMGWQRGARSPGRSFFGVFLADRGDHPRVKRRMRMTGRLLAPLLAGCATIRSKGRSPLARLFSLTYLGDWVSFYLALLNGVDPTPVAPIETIKAMMKGRPKQEVRLG